MKYRTIYTDKPAVVERRKHVKGVHSNRHPLILLSRHWIPESRRLDISASVYMYAAVAAVMLLLFKERARALWLIILVMQNGDYIC
jgi:hypothetical protein